MKSLRLLLAVLVIFSLSSCATSSVTKIGSESLAPLNENSDVQVFSNQSEVKKTFTPLGIISYTNPGKYQILTLNDAIPELKKKARSLGANGVIIDESAPVKSGIISTGISVRATAIHID